MDDILATNILHVRMVTRCRTILHSLQFGSMPHHVRQDIEFLLFEIDHHIEHVLETKPPESHPELLNGLQRARISLLSALDHSAKLDQTGAAIQLGRAFSDLMDHVMAAKRSSNQGASAMERLRIRTGRDIEI